jgi:hypothetical protein
LSFTVQLAEQLPIAEFHSRVVDSLQRKKEEVFRFQIPASAFVAKGLNPRATFRNNSKIISIYLCFIRNPRPVPKNPKTHVGLQDLILRPLATARVT